MTQFDYAQASAYVNALTGEPVETARMWWRLIHDNDKEVAAHKYYGTLPEVWATLCDYNSRGWGVFCNINAFPEPVPGLPLHENRHNLADVSYIRAHPIDLDNTLTAQQNYALVANSNPAPSFAVGTSPGKFHVYFCVNPYQGNEYYNVLQRKLRQVYDGDKSVIDPTRVLRVPGFMHMKNPAQPHLVTCWALNGYGNRLDVTALNDAYAHVNVIDSGGGRHALGDPELAAPSLEWLKFGLMHLDPNTLDRGEWISVTSAFKQAGWSLADEQTLLNIWSEWCARYGANDLGENTKQWNSIRDTQIGWNSIKRRVPVLLAYEKFGFKDTPTPQPSSIIPATAPLPGANSNPPPPKTEETFGDILSAEECARYFKNCYFIEREGKILNPRGRFMNATQFNGAYGGKLFIIAPDGKTTDEPWKAATRSTVWTIPKVDHVRFVPTENSYEMIYDDLERVGINTYVPAKVKRQYGDVSPFINHVAKILPVESDRKILFDFMAHNVKYPGEKIAWAILIQSTEGVGKGFIKEALSRAIGRNYVYYPKAPELVKSGSVFNAWMRAKLMIIVDEIKIDERRELIEILKPMISDPQIEIQSKGVDQEIEDNPANWMFFSNFKDAIPVGQNGRRYSVFYSALQSKEDKIAAGLNDQYFAALFQWLRNGGAEIVTDWLMSYPIERNAIVQEAPETSSHGEAVRLSRGPIEVAIQNAIDDMLCGFRGGYVSVIAVSNRLRQLSIRQPAQATICRILEQMGFVNIGRAVRPYSQENMNEKTDLFATNGQMPVGDYGRMQGYE